MPKQIDQLTLAEAHKRWRPFVTLGTYPIPCEACGAESNHETASGAERQHHYLCTCCMNDWSEWCDWNREQGRVLTIRTWSKWFEEFMQYTDRRVTK